MVTGGALAIGSAALGVWAIRNNPASLFAHPGKQTPLPDHLRKPFVSGPQFTTNTLAHQPYVYLVGGAIGGSALAIGGLFVNSEKLKDQKVQNIRDLFRGIRRDFSEPGVIERYGEHNAFTVALDQKERWAINPFAMVYDNHGAYSGFDRFRDLENAPPLREYAAEFRTLQNRLLGIQVPQEPQEAANT